MDPVLHLILRIAFALLFGVAAGHKLRDPGAFRATLAAYRLVPAALAPAVIAGEVVVTAALCVPGPLGPLGAAGMLALYAAAIGINLWRGRRHIDCGCAGPAARRPIGGGLVARNVVLALAALAGLAAVHDRGLAWVDGVTVLAAVLALAALYGATDNLLALRRAAA